jgi:CheY-like chemotaxis protein
MKILITEDSKFMRSVLRDILESHGHSIIEAQNGNEALALYEKEQPDLILLDIIMPEVTGLEVLKKIGGIAKIIVISAVGQEKMIEEAKSLGALDYITKPFDEERVTSTVNKVGSE